MEQSRLKVKKHTLDSDEEDDVKPVNVMTDADIEGQEDATVDIEEGIRFTPFNMKDELEEGHFDADGMYIFKRSKDELHDQWIEDVNWSEVKWMEKVKETRKDDEIVNSEQESNFFDEMLIYNEMLTVMKPSETVLNAIKRLGKESKDNKLYLKNPSRMQKNKRIKTDNSNIDGECSSGNLNTFEKETERDDITDKKEKLLALIGCADKLLLNGYVEVYQDTFEKLSLKLNSLKKNEAVKNSNPAVDADFDIFGDDIKLTTEEVQESRLPVTDEITWEFKWVKESDAELHGPFTSLQMLQWSEDGYFEDGVYIRKAASNGEFYSSKRLDFKLYI